MGQRVHRRQADHGPARPTDPPLPHRRDGQRILPIPPEQRPGQSPNQVARASQAASQQGGDRRTLLIPLTHAQSYTPTTPRELSLGLHPWSIFNEQRWSVFNERQQPTSRTRSD